MEVTDHVIPVMERPLPFIQITGNDQLEINKDVLKQLQGLTYPVTSIAIAGKYRTGKSFLMNKLFEAKSGFPLGDTVQAETRGIWIWVKPHPLDKNRCLILLDSEGLDDPEKGDETSDLKIFALALLLSSYFMFNVVGTIDDGALQQLHLVSELTKHIHTGKTENGSVETGEDFSRYFPDFAMVLRDFYLDLKINGKTCTLDEYLEHSLKLKPGQSTRVKNYNIPRECLRAYFPKRKCFALPRPKENVLQLEKTPVSEINPEFLKKADETVKSVLNEASVFKINTDVITVKRFLALAEMYVDAMNKGSVPNIESSVELLKRKECQEALEAAVQQYNAHMQSGLTTRMPVTGNELSSCHKESFEKALETFHQLALFDDEEYAKKLTEEVQRSYDEMSRLNDAKSLEKCKQLIADIFNSLNKNVEGKKYTVSGGYSRYKSEKNAAVDRYNQATNKGPVADTVLDEYLKTKELEEKAILQADQALSEREKKLAEEQTKRQKQEQETRAQKEKNDKLIREMKDQQEHNKQVIQKMEKDYEHQLAEERLKQQQIIEQKQKDYAKLKEEGSAKAAEYEKQLQSLQNEKDALDKATSDLQNQIQETQSLYSNLEQQFQAAQSSSAATIQSLNNQITQLTNQINSRRRRRRRRGFRIF